MASERRLIVRTPKGEYSIDTAIQDLKFVFRSVARRPVFTASVLLTLGLGIGANTAIFSVVNGVLLDPLPFEAADRLVTPNVMSTQGFYISTSIPNYYDWKDQSRSFCHDGLGIGHLGRGCDLGHLRSRRPRHTRRPGEGLARGVTGTLARPSETP